MRTPHGFALLELILVLAILGALLGLGLSFLRSDRLAVNQAAQSLVAQVTRARLEAIRRNEFVGIRFSTEGKGGYVVFVDANRNQTYDSGETLIQAVSFGQGDWARARLSALAGAATLVFDPRGIPQAFAGATLTLSDPSGTYTKVVALSPQGRASLP